jgi:two-component system, chemotaxis family, chemotaxis protein CheY
MRFFFDYKPKHHSIYDYNGRDFRNAQDAFDFAEATAQLLKMMSGDWINYSIEVRDAEDKKYFSVPVEPGHSSLQLVNIGSRQSAQRRIRLLIIEDRHVHSAVIGRSAAKLGFAVTNAHSYESAIDTLSTQEFACITLDLGLGDHVGIDVLRYLGSIHSRAQIIVISETDRETRDDVVELGRALGLNVYASMPKPIDLGTLTKMLMNIQNRLARQEETTDVKEQRRTASAAAAAVRRRVRDQSCRLRRNSLLRCRGTELRAVERYQPRRE